MKQSTHLSFGRVAGAFMALLLPLMVGAQEPDWDTYDAVLASHVSRGSLYGVDLNVVDYVGLAADARFQTVVSTLEGFDPASLAGKAETIAFYINAYNILTLKMVIDHLPRESIKEIGSLFRPVWKKTAGRIGGADVSLDDIEHRTLRKLGDPRMHMAIVCASVSCPDLRPEAYRAELLDRQLDEQTHAFLHNPGKGARITDGGVLVSRIFDWFQEDFAATGGVAAFIRRYLELPDNAQVDADIDYDWRLNGVTHAPQGH